jgi:hypothetical protein
MRVLTFAAFVLAHLFSTALAQAEDIFIEDARPLLKTAKLIEARCHCAVTYVDPKWDLQQTRDATPARQQNNPAVPRLRVPNEHSFIFTLPAPIEGQAHQELALSMRGILEAYTRSGNNPPAFKLTVDESAFHLSPRTGSVLDVRISMKSAEGPIAQVLETLLATISSASGVKVAKASGPVNQLMKKVQFSADDERAETVLMRLLAMVGPPLSWRLLYDIGFDQYYLNLVVVT